jgi:CHASE2 domain-containing sensor protein
LGSLLVIGMLSATTGLMLHARVQGIVDGLLKGRGLPHGAALGVSYALVFAASFAALMFLSHHVSLKFSVKAKGLEKTSGFAPKFARFLLGGILFAAPLAVLLHHGAQEKLSLRAIIAESERKAQQESAGQGYGQSDREKLGQLLQAGEDK